MSEIDDLQQEIKELKRTIHRKNEEIQALRDNVYDLKSEKRVIELALEEHKKARGRAYDNWLTTQPEEIGNEKD